MSNNLWMKMHNDVKLPAYETHKSVGMDLRAYLPKGSIVLKPRQITIVPTGLRTFIPEGYEVQIRPRSGLAIKKGVTVVNSPGTIDPDYKGEIMVGLINLGDRVQVITNGDRIAQAVMSPVAFAVAEVKDRYRGEGGIGHTG